MKKTKRQRRFEQKHYLAGIVRRFPYMLHHNPYVNKKQRKIFDLVSYRIKVMALVSAVDRSEGFPHGNRGSRGACFVNGIFLNYGDMTFTMCLGDGVFRTKKK